MTSSNNILPVDSEFAAAISHGEYDKAALLLKEGANINRIIPTSQVIDRSVYDETTTYLINAAGLDRVETVKFLLKHGADTSIAGIFSGETALLAAARCGHAEAVELLIKHGADISPLDTNSKRTALDYAISSENALIVRSLLAAGATRNNFQHLSFSMGSGAAAREIVQMLLNHGVDINTQDDWGRTPLMWAAEYSPVETVQFLIDSGADVNRISGKNMNGVCSEESALQLARRAKRDDVAALLLRHGAVTRPARYERRSLFSRLRKRVGL